MKKYLFGLILALCISSLCFAEQTTNAPKHIIFKGLNTKAGPLSMDDGESPDCMNVHTNIFGTLVRRNGYAQLNTTHAHVTTTPGVVNGLYDFAVNETTRKLMAYIDTGLYKMDDLDGSFDQINLKSAFSDDNMIFENFDNVLIMTTLSRDYAQYWDGSAVITSHLQITPKGKYQIKAYNRWFLSDCDDGTGTIYPLRFYYTEPGTYQTIDTYETLDANAGDVAMGWGLLKGRLVGFTKYTVNIISDVGGNDPIFTDRRIDGTGCGAARTIKTINHPKYGESLVWLTSDKRLVLWNGSNLIDVGEKIQSSNSQCTFYMNAINATYMYKSHAQVYEKNGWYVLWVPISTTIGYCVIYDYKTDTLWPCDAQTFDSSAVVTGSAGNVIYVGERTGEVHLWDSGNNDDGSDINSNWTSTKWTFDFLPSLKKMGLVVLTLKAIGNYDLTFYDKYDFDYTWSVAETINMLAASWVLGNNLPATLGGKYAIIERINIDRNFNTYQIKLVYNSNDPAFEVYGLDLLTVRAGIGEGQ